MSTIKLFGLDGKDKIDIISIDTTKPINNKNAIAGVLPTGNYSKLLVRKNYPKSLTILSIENKFANRFDNPSYYHGSNWEKLNPEDEDIVDGGDLDGGDLTQIVLNGGDLDGGDI